MMWRVCYKSLYAIILIVGSVWFTGCTGLKKVPENKFLYDGSEIEIQSADQIPNKNALKNQLNSLMKPDPNETIFGMRPRLWIHYVTKDTSNNKGIDYWLNKNLGEEPVYLDQANPRNIQQVIERTLENKGYFSADVSYQINRKTNTASIQYSATVESPYTIKEYILPSDTTTKIISHIHEAEPQTLIKENENFDLSKISDERQRVDDYLKNQGYYGFAPEYLLFEVDSTVGAKQVSIKLNLKKNIPAEATQVYRIGKIVLNPNFTLLSDTLKSAPDTLNIQNVNYVVSANETFDRRVLIRSLFLEKDSVYSKAAHQQTIRRFVSLGVFQFVNIRYEEMDTGVLQANVLLAPSKRKTIRFELEGVAQSDQYVGPNLNVRFQNKNFLGGAELFELNLTGGLEFNISSQGENVNSSEIGAETRLTVPRFITPFNITNQSSYYTPKTRFELSYQRLNRFQLFTVNSFNATIGYLWNETASRRHELNIMDINFFRVPQISDEFQEEMQESPYLQRSFEEKFILGTNYTFTYNNQEFGGDNNRIFFRGTLDLSGNLMHLVQSTFRDPPSNGSSQYSLFNRAYSQFARLILDYRIYYQFVEDKSIAFRIFSGVGVPYGNSETLPFIKQFFIGGTNSIRAFPVRSLGPGTYNSSDEIYDQYGDIKLESNFEYRFPIYGLFKGAVFLDAGNIWLLNPDQEIMEERPGGAFRWDTFYEQLALGTGFGLRIDVDFFVLRFDFGYPLRKPFLPVGHRWIDFNYENPETGENEWSLDELVFNIGIGYPF